jgi:hypothetical protein
MKTLALLVIYILSFISIFFILSLVGILFTDYISVIKSDNWAGAYCLFFGWWMAAFPTREFYIMYKEQFDLIY